ncbi:hypothetical protein EV361DRAFT_281950 [Lentinula raphanica]|nr:hypothetical protein EV361DRAFT_281950 [Lentinula raphanica]
MEPIPEHLKFDSCGNPFIPTYGVSVLNKHPLDVEGKNRLHTISVDFGTTTFIQLAGLSDLPNTSTTKRRLKIHSIVIAYARKNEYNNSLGASELTASFSDTHSYSSLHQFFPHQQQGPRTPNNHWYKQEIRRFLNTLSLQIAKAVSSLQIARAVLSTCRVNIGSR